MVKNTAGPVSVELLRFGEDGTRGFAITSPNKNQPICGIGVATPNITTTLSARWKNCHTEADQFFTAEELEANAALIAEAFNVANETGLTPRELAGQRAKLLAALKAATTALNQCGIHNPAEAANVAIAEVEGKK